MGIFERLNHDGDKDTYLSLFDKMEFSPTGRINRFNWTIKLFGKQHKICLEFYGWRNQTYTGSRIQPPEYSYGIEVADVKTELGDSVDDYIEKKLINSLKQKKK